MVVVKKQKGESDDRLIARFRKKIIDEGILLTLRDKKRFKKKSQERKERMYRLKHENEIRRKRTF